MEHILGQCRAVEVLTAALAGRRMHHAYIFHGPIGVGKFTTALAFARLILCPNAQTDLSGRFSACGSCESCRLLDHDSHPDLHVVHKELAATSSVTQLRSRKQMNIPVDLLREHVVGGTTSDDKFHDAPAYKSPHLRHRKVFIIDEAELLEPVGQNALLKTLEEPPAGTYFILVTSNEERLLPTVRSRCQRVAFVPLPQDVVASWLAKRETALDESMRPWLVGYSDGSLGRAQLAIQYELHLWARTVLPALDDMTRHRCDASLGGRIAAMMDDFAQRWVDNHAGASKEAANKQAMMLMWSLIGQEARRRLANLGAACDPTDPDAAESTLSPWLDVIDALGEAQRQINSNVNVGLACDNLVCMIDRALAGRTSVGS